MKTILRLTLTALTLAFGLQPLAFGQGTAFTYQGRLNDGPNPAQGTYDFRFTLRDALTGGSPVGVNPLAATLPVNNGLFTVTLDPGAGVFTGANRWLEIAVRTNGAGAFATLVPRQPLSAAPYALYAMTPAGPQGLQGPPGPAGSADAWSRTGNAGANPTNGAFLGTTDNQPLEFKVNGQRGLRLQPALDGTVHVIGGYSGNVVSANRGGTIAGGGSAGFINQVTDSFGAVGGGSRNSAGFNATVAGGDANTASGLSSMVPGGYQNTAGGARSFAAGTQAKANHDGAFVWADNNFTDFASAAANQFLIRAAGGVGINTNNPSGAALHVAGNQIISGNVGIGTNNPGARLHVVGPVRLGSESGTSEAPNKPGLVVRRINSTSSTSGQVVARSATGGVALTLERDGTPGGFLVRFASAIGAAVVTGSGIDRSGNPINVYKVYYNGTTGTSQIFTTGQFVGHFRLSFGNPFFTDDMTEVVLTRFVDASGNDTVNWVGTVTSTVNQ